MTFTIVGKNSNYVEELPAFYADATEEDVNQYKADADIVAVADDGTITLECEFDDDSPNEVYVVTRNA